MMDSKVKFQKPAVGFTLLEIMIVVAVMGIVVSIAAPTWFRQREISRSRACAENLTKIDAAKEQYALEFNLSNGGTIAFADLVVPPGSGTSQGYLKSTPICPSSGVYSLNLMGVDPTCSIGSSNSPFSPHEMP